MTKTVPELFKELNEDPDKAVNYKNNMLLTILFTHAYIKDAKFVLPEGTPPYTPCSEPVGMTPSNLIFEAKKLNRFCRTDLTPLKREGLFISVLESLCPDEVNILLAIKEQKLQKLYKKLNKKFAIKHGYITDDKITEEE